MNYSFEVNDLMGTVDFLQNQGFYRYWNNENSYSLIRVQNNVANIVSDFQIIDVIKHQLRSENRHQDFNKFMNGLNRKNLIETLDYFKGDFIRDDYNEGYFFFNNKGILVNKSDLYEVDYNELQGLIWNTQIIKRQFGLNNEKSVFEQFVIDISGTEDRKEQLESYIGFLLSDYKNPANNPAIILTDSDKDLKQANGGTGKSLLMKGISNMVNTVQMDGKNIRNNFKYSNVDASTQIIYFDDVEDTFDFKRYYSVTTGEIPVEQKYKNTYNLPFEIAPKIAISSNYTVKSDGGNSDLRRRAEFEFSNYYNGKLTPETKFNQRFFIDWSPEEWNSFYLYMMNCMKLFLRKGLIIPEVCKEEYAKKQMGIKSFDFMNNHIDTGRIYTSELREKFKAIKPNINPKEFTQLINEYCNLMGIRTERKKSNGQVYLEVEK